ncbi:MAG TPA: HNH endonuclease, partial [Anaerolineae bacterium]|nr:HNH endonuclease [Anaerolineae bacterium]
EELRQHIREADQARCAYCLTSEANSGIPLTIDHIRPLSRGGQTVFENLCLACRTCNEFKADRTDAEDPLSGDLCPLFNPRTQKWTDHFEWSADGTRMSGFTAIGRATIIALRVNEEVIVAARRRWVLSGWHPPKDLQS